MDTIKAIKPGLKPKKQDRIPGKRKIIFKELHNN